MIPAYNEREAVGGVVRALREALAGRVRELEILVVDDGSTDGTAGAARAAEATVLAHPVNKGYGQSLLTGIAAARHDWILMIDGDGSYPASEAVKLLDSAPAFDMVVGARTGAHFWGTGTQAFLRSVYLAIASFIVGEPLPDANSGLRLVRKSMAASTGPVQCLGYSFTTTMTLSFFQAGRFVRFIPIEFAARTGRSKVKPVRDILRTLQLMTQVMLAFNPLKLFVTLAALPAAAGLLLGFGWLCCGSGATLIAAVLCAVAALHCFIAGCVLDSLRMHRPGKTTP